MSLRAALALSLKDAESQKQKDTTPNGKVAMMQSNTSKSTALKKKKQSSTPSSSTSSKAASRSNRINIEIPHQKLTKCIRNTLPSQIDTHGFVELSNILPSQLLTNIKNHAISKIENDSDNIEIISNALQIDLSKELFNEMKVNLVKNEIVEETMKFVYGQPPPPVTSEGDVTSSTSSEGKGSAIEEKQPKSSSNYKGYIIETPKILVALPGSAPQLPHADDHCSSCIICLLHLSNGQEPTRVAVYDKTKDYPTGITVTCDSEYIYIVLFLCYFVLFFVGLDGLFMAVLSLLRRQFMDWIGVSFCLVAGYCSGKKTWPNIEHKMCTFGMYEWVLFTYTTINRAIHRFNKLNNNIIA